MSDEKKHGFLKTMFAGIGLVDRAHNAFSKLYDELVERGQLKSSDSNDYLKQVLLRARGEREDLDEVIIEILRDVSRSLGLASRKEVEDMELRLEKLENMLKDKGRVSGVAEEKDVSIEAFRGVEEKGGEYECE